MKEIKVNTESLKGILKLLSNYNIFLAFSLSQIRRVIYIIND